MNTHRGIANLVLIAAIALGAVVVYEWNTLFAGGRNKSVADKTAAAATQTSQQAAVVAITAKDLQKAVNAAVSAAVAEEKNHQAIEANAAGFSYAANTALLSESNPSPRVQLATKLTDSAFKALGAKLPPEQKMIWDALLAARDDDKAAIAARDAKITAMTIDAVRVAGTLDATVARATQAEATVKTQSATIVTQTTDLKTEAVKSAALAEQNKSWADREPGLWARIKALCVLSVLLVIGLVAYEIHRRGITGALKDAVALAEHTKAIAVAAGADAPAVEAKIAGWWGDAHKDLADFNAVKSKLRL